MRGFAQKCNSRKVPIQIKEEFTATHFLLVSPFLVCNHPLTLSRPSPSSRLRKSRILSYPDFLSKEITAVVQCISSRRYTFANNTTQIEIKTQLNAGEREEERKGETLWVSSTNICALPDTGVFLKSFRIARRWGCLDWCAMSFSKHNDFT